jgi:hypothetical protein
MDLILGVISVLGKILDGVLSAIPFNMPSQVQDSMIYFAGYLKYLGGYVDIPGVMAALIFLCNFLIAWFSFKLVLWVYHLVVSRRVHEKQALPAQTKN